jgi:beta-fructofuranosidase
MVETKDGWVIMGFADSGPDTFIGHVMDPEPVEVGADGLLTVRRLSHAAE